MPRLIAVSNRAPRPGDRGSTGGLAVALQGAMEGRGGLWLGWSGKVVDDPDFHASPRFINAGRID